MLAVPAGHRFAGRTIGLDELVAEPLIVMQAGAGVRTVIEDELRRAGVRPRDLRIAMEMGLQESAKAAVEAGYGVSFLSSLALDRELRLGTLATAEVDGIDPVREFSTVRPAHTPPSRLVEAFLAYCRDDARHAQPGRRRAGRDHPGRANPRLGRVPQVTRARRPGRIVTEVPGQEALDVDRAGLIWLIVGRR